MHQLSTWNGQARFCKPDPTELDRANVQPTLLPPLGLQASATKPGGNEPRTGYYKEMRNYSTDRCGINF
ncbi:hypothetical protein Hanom_Chr07g00594201 [Helianthus anomalus]